MSHDGVTKKEIDHVLTRQRDRGLFKPCRAYRSAEAPANTDHLLLASDLRLTLLKARRKTPVCQAPFDTTCLIQDTAVQQQYAVTVQNKFDGLGTLSDNVDAHWDSFCSIIRSSADTVVGVRKNIRKPWLSAETFDVIEHKAEARRQNNHATRKRLHGIFKAKAKADRKSYLKSITDEVENNLVHTKMGSVFRGIKQLAGTNTKPLSTTIHKADGSPCQSETFFLSFALHAQPLDCLITSEM